MADSSESEGNNGTRDVEMEYADSYFAPPGGVTPKVNGSNGVLSSVEQPTSGQTPHQPPGLQTQLSEDNANTTQDRATPTSSASSEPVIQRAAMKKKGTAATKKGPARKKLVKAKQKKPKGATAKKDKSGVPGEQSSGGEDGDDDGDDDEGDDEGDEVDNGPYCICRGPDDHRWMIGCDVCEDWFHGECVSIDKQLGEKLIERFVCPNCTDAVNYTKYKKMCSYKNCTNPARLRGDDDDDEDEDEDDDDAGEKEGKGDDEKGFMSVFCSKEHSDAWWASMIGSLPSKSSSKKAVEVLTQEDFMGLLAATAAKQEGGFKLGDAPFGTYSRKTPTNSVSHILIY
jgi:COMPASS component SPP1